MWHMKIVKNNNPKINYKYWVCVAGYLKDGTYIESSPILDAESPRVVVSENSRYYLKYNTTIQKKLPPPSFNVDELNKFLNGFPKDWKSIIKEQISRIYGKDCVISLSTEKKIYANIQKTDELFDVLHKNIFENGSDSNRTVKAQHVDSNHHLVKDHLKKHKKLRNFYLDDTNIEISSYKGIFKKSFNQNRVEEFNNGRYNRSDTAIMFYNQEDMFANKDIKENRNNKTSFYHDANYQCGSNNQSYYSPYKNSYLHEKSTTENQINNMCRYPESKDISIKNSNTSHPYDVGHQKTIPGAKNYSEKNENDRSERHDFGQKLFTDRKRTNRNDSKSKNSVKQSNKKKEIFRIERPNDSAVGKEVKRQDTINSKYPIIKIKGADIAVADFSKKTKDSDYTSASFKNTEKRKFVLDELDEDSEKVENSSEDSNNSSYKKEEAMKLGDKKILYDDIILNKKTVEFKNSGTEKNIKLIINEKDNDLPMLNS
ncbi:PREDICTED: homeobox protein 12-like [Polistes dominula]|uniref:Homeobox protein 12-like n=1 Tax=Polistes dominula TaxID=743375 RepID=A0ABM1JAB2_POLDO|nr:PREDICTED: homeobox protein 12-like [Polistes dominula]